MTIQSIDSLTIVDPILGPSLTQLDARGCKRALLLFDYFLNNAATRPSNASGCFTKSDRIRVLVRVGTTPVGFEDSGRTLLRLRLILTARWSSPSSTLPRCHAFEHPDGLFDAFTFGAEFSDSFS